MGISIRAEGSPIQLDLREKDFSYFKFRIQFNIIIKRGKGEKSKNLSLSSARRQRIISKGTAKFLKAKNSKGSIDYKDCIDLYGDIEDLDEMWISSYSWSSEYTTWRNFQDLVLYCILQKKKLEWGP